MNELIRITTSAVGTETAKTVNARELHSFLQSKQEFAHWIKNRIEKYGFEEGVDYAIDKIIKRAGIGSTTSIEYHLSLDMAKEISMVENNEMGRKARQYFIKVEKRYNQVLAEATKRLTEENITLAKNVNMLATSKELNEDKIRELQAENFHFENKFISQENAIHRIVFEENQELIDLREENQEVIALREKNQELQKIISSQAHIIVTLTNK